MLGLMDIQSSTPISFVFSTHELNRALLIVLLAILISSVLFFIASFFIIAHVLFHLHLKRKNKSTWSRDCSGDEPLLRKMYDDGIRWANERREFCKDVHMYLDELRDFVIHITLQSHISKVVTMYWPSISVHMVKVMASITHWASRNIRTSLPGVSFCMMITEFNPLCYMEIALAVLVVFRYLPVLLVPGISMVWWRRGCTRIFMRVSVII